jgi:SAM-dependent methyltransferase
LRGGARSRPEWFARSALIEWLFHCEREIEKRQPMGIEINAAQLLLRSRQQGVSFARTATLGRQSLNLDRQELLAVLRAAGGEFAAAGPAIAAAEERFADPLLRALGAAEVVAIDASDYEGAQIIHDMNQPIDEKLANSFDVVFDGGTLEHVFNFPVALASAMRLVRPGGRFIGFTPANNFFGHGFYQFSAELYYRVFSPENGFEVEEMVAWEEVTGSHFHSVSDPRKVRSRIEFFTRLPTYLYVQARKTADVPLFRTAPQQSDYVMMWDDEDRTGATAQLPDTLPFRLRKMARRLGISKTLASMPLAMRLRQRVFRTGQLRENLRGYCPPLPGLKVRYSRSS